MNASKLNAILELLRVKPRDYDDFCPKCGMGHEGECYETPKQRQKRTATEYQAMTCASGPGYWEDDS